MMGTSWFGNAHVLDFSELRSVRDASDVEASPRDWSSTPDDEMLVDAHLQSGPVSLHCRPSEPARPLFRRGFPANLPTHPQSEDRG